MRIVDLPDVVEFESKDVNEKHVHSVVIMKKVPAVPLRFSAESCSIGIPDWDGPDYQYSMVTTLFFEDGSTFNHTYLDFSPGTHDWETQEVLYRPRIPITKIQVDYFFEHKKGKVAYRNFRIEEIPARAKPDKRIVLLEASNIITSYLPMQHRLDVLLSEKLERAHPELDIEVENSGVGGETVKRLIESKRYERDLLTLDGIDIIFISYGGNDSNRYDVKTFETYHRELISRLRSDFQGIRIIMHPGTWVDYPKHYSSDMNEHFRPFYDVLRELATEADGLVNIPEILRQEVDAGNWDLRYRNNRLGKLILDNRFDEGHEDDPAWFSNIHHNPNANQIIAQAEFDCITDGKLL